jgi:hypothetical protein
MQVLFPEEEAREPIDIEKDFSSRAGRYSDTIVFHEAVAPDQ